MFSIIDIHLDIFNISLEFRGISNKRHFSGIRYSKQVRPHLTSDLMHLEKLLMNVCNSNKWQLDSNSK